MTYDPNTDARNLRYRAQQQAQAEADRKRLEAAPREFQSPNGQTWYTCAGCRCFTQNPPIEGWTVSMCNVCGRQG